MIREVVMLKYWNSNHHCKYWLWIWECTHPKTVNTSDLLKCPTAVQSLAVLGTNDWINNVVPAAVSCLKCDSLLWCWTLQIVWSWRNQTAGSNKQTWFLLAFFIEPGLGYFTNFLHYGVGEKRWQIGPSHFFIKWFFQHENEGKTPRHMPKTGLSATLRWHSNNCFKHDTLHSHRLFCLSYTFSFKQLGQIKNASQTRTPVSGG